MRQSVCYSIGAALAACVISAPANAVLLNFDLTGSRNASFQLDSNPTPTTANPGPFGDQIQFANLPGIFAGVAGTGTVSFGTGVINRLDISGTPLGFTQFSGPELFTGGAAAPMFATGTFELTSIVSGRSTLVISEAMAPIPEPATWAMLIAGFGMIGRAARGRRIRFAIESI